MEILALLAFSGVLWGVISGDKPKAPKTAEEELGAALSKYLLEKKK